MHVQLDHILTFANVPDLDVYIDRYRALGFDISADTYRYQPGLRNRFVRFGCEYLELVWVEHEAAFARGGTDEFARMFPDLPALRHAARPFSIGFVAPDVAALHQHWTQRGVRVPPVWSFAPPDMPPILSFQEIPDTLLPGASCFAITYHTTAPGQVRTVQRAANTIYALDGVTLVSPAPADAARRWHTLLTPTGALTAVDDVYTVHVPPHTIWWMTPARFHALYGGVWNARFDRVEQIAAIHVLADDLTVAAAHVGSAAYMTTVRVDDDARLVVAPTGEDGVRLVIRANPIEQWQNERTQVTGEGITIG